MTNRFRFSSARALVAMILGVATGACGADASTGSSAPLEKTGSTLVSFEDFAASLHREEGTGAYIVEGDIAIPNDEMLKDYYSKYVRQGALIVEVNNNVDSAWAGNQRLALTYCVSTASFGANHATVVAAMEVATSAWEQVANVDFQYRPGDDASCTTANNNVVFNVEATTDAGLNAAAFFPHYARAQRNLRINFANATNAAPKTLAGVLRHELGHALGFRHEHIRGTGCPESDTTWRALTTYDTDSVMHYPPYAVASCNGTNRGDYLLTQRDREGSSSLYGASLKKNFNGDIHTDVLWRNEALGKVSAWFMDGTTVTSGGDLSWNVPGSEWQVEGTGDFNRDGQTDVLWHHRGNGRVAVWYMNGTTVISDADLSWNVKGNDWDIIGTGDFNRDGNIDVLWHNAGNGRVAVWYMNGVTVTGDADLSWNVPGTEWLAKGTGDFNRDGNVDVLWHHAGNGRVAVWYMNGVTVTGDADLSWNVPGTEWDLAGTGDFNRDGQVDLLWHHPTSGRVATWFMNGVTVAGTGDLTWNVPGTDWKIVSR